MKRPWIYLENPMETATANSFRLANRISSHHYVLIKGRISEPFFLELYDNYAPAHQEFYNKYIKWKSAKGGQTASTIELNRVIHELMSDKIKNWASQIIVAHGTGTPRYLGLMGNGKKPFQNGSADDRLMAVSVLILAIGDDAALATLKTQVEDFYDVFDTKFKEQQGAINKVKWLSRETEAARKEMCIKQYENLGKMISHSARQTNTIARFFDLKAMRRNQQVLYTGQVKMLTVKTIAKHTFAEGEQVELENTGTTVLYFYFGSAKKQAPGNEVITIEPGSKQTVTAHREESVNNPYLLVYNPDEANKGEFTAEFL